jgi:hypothetical protein
VESSASGARHKGAARPARELGTAAPDCHKRLRQREPGAGLAGLGAVEVIIDPNPNAPRARDCGTERRHLLEVKDVYEQRAS